MKNGTKSQWAPPKHPGRLLAEIVASSPTRKEQVVNYLLDDCDIRVLFTDFTSAKLAAFEEFVNGFAEACPREMDSPAAIRRLIRVGFFLRHLLADARKAMGVPEPETEPDPATACETVEVSYEDVQERIAYIATAMRTTFRCEAARAWRNGDHLRWRAARLALRKEGAHWLNLLGKAKAVQNQAGRLFMIIDGDEVIDVRPVTRA